MNEIPKIMHQIWGGDTPLPSCFKEISKTWTEHHSNWRYEFWDDNRINSFVREYYPQYWATFSGFKYNIQRWDAIRYLILNSIGGMYVDFDYECLEPLDNLIKEKTCCFTLEPQSHCDIFGRRVMFNNALMLSTPKHSFMNKIVNHVFSEKNLQFETSSPNIYVFNTTGPWALIDLYEKMSEDDKNDVYLIPDKYVTPFDVMQARRFRMGEMSYELNDQLKEACAVHYFFNSWLKND